MPFVQKHKMLDSRDDLLQVLQSCRANFTLKQQGETKIAGNTRKDIRNANHQLLER